MTVAADVALWQGLAIFLFGCLLVIGVATKFGPQEPECSPDCNHCPAWRREQEAKAAMTKPLPYCPVCWKRHKPSDPHR